MLNLGDYPVDGMVDLKWPTQGADGASITRATDGSVRVYKDNSATQRASASGITDTEDFDSLTGVHHLRIDLSDNDDAGFYAAGHEYQVVLVGAVVDGITVNYPLAHFSIERAGGALALLKSGTFGLSALKTLIDTVDDLLDTEVGAIKAVTDKLDETLEDDSGVHRFTAHALEEGPGGGSAPTAEEVATAVWEAVIEADSPGFSAEELLRIISAAVAGLVSGLDTGSPAFRNLPDTKTRIAGTADADGNRTAATYDGTP